MYRFENALKEIWPSGCLPYVDTRLDCTLLRPSDSSLFTREHFGNNDGPVRTGFAANWRPEPSDCDIFGNGVLTRSTSRSSCRQGLHYTNTLVRRVLNRRSYDDLCWPYNRRNSFERDHAGPHIWIGGHMRSLTCAPNDPLFWNHHCFIDKCGENLRDTLPANRWTYPTSWRVQWSHRADNQMRPFNMRNRDGLDDEEIGKEYLYELSPADDTCSSDTDCSPTRLLWCGGGRCRATARQGGLCRTGEHASCYCGDESDTPRCNGGRCACLSTP